MGNIKSTIFIGLIILLSLVGASQVNAALEILEQNVTLDVDYGDFINEDQLTIRESFSFTVRNSNNDAASLKFTFDSLPSGYNASTINTINLSAGEERSITGSIEVPHTRATGRSNIGSLVLRDLNNAELDRLTIDQTTKSMLFIDRLEVDYTDVDGNSQSDRFDAADQTLNLDENVRPGSEITITITYKNQFDRDYDSDKSVIEDITLDIEASDSDLFDDSIDDNVDLSDLDANDKEEYQIQVKISDTIDADSYDVEFTLEGTDGENFDHNDQKTLKIDVERLRNDVRVTNSEITGPVDSCVQSLFFDISIQNFGTRDQKYVAFALTNTEMGINYKVNDLLLEKFDDDDTYSNHVEIPLTKTLKEGSQSIDLKVFTDRDNLIDQKRIPLQVTKCTTASNTPVQTTTSTGSSTSVSSGNGTTAGTTSTKNATAAQTGAGSQTTTPSTSDTTTSSVPVGASVIQTVEEPYSTDDFFVGGLIVAIIVVVALIVVFFILLLR